MRFIITTLGIFVALLLMLVGITVAVVLPVLLAQHLGAGVYSVPIGIAVVLFVVSALAALSPPR